MGLEVAYPYRLRVSGTEALFESEYDLVRLSPIAAKSIGHIAKSLDGSHSEEQLCARYPNFANDIQLFLVAARNEGVVVDSELQSSSVPGKSLFEAVEAQIPHWNERLFSHALWQGLYNGEADDSVARGWAIETYFFIRGAIFRMPSVISACDNGAMKDIFLEHFTEEFDHYRFFATSLERLGMDVEKIEMRGALPTTDAVINFTKYASRKHPICYAVCSGLLESTGTDAEKGRAFYRNVEKHYDPKGAGWVSPMLEHVDLDESYEHGSVLKEIFNLLPVVERSIADDVFKTIEMFVQTLIQWFDEILFFYSNNNAENCNLIYKV